MFIGVQKNIGMKDVYNIVRIKKTGYKIICVLYKIYMNSCLCVCM